MFPPKVNRPLEIRMTWRVLLKRRTFYMKRILSILLALLLAIGLLSAGTREVKAEGAVTNIQLNGDILTWDPYPGATGYAIVFGDPMEGLYFFVDTNSADLKAELGRTSAASGTYTLEIQALGEVENNSIPVIAVGDSNPTYTYISKGKVPTPTGIRWGEGNTAMWDTVTIPETSLLNYDIILYKNGEYFDTYYSWGQPGYDLNSHLVGENNRYSFSVRAYYEGYDKSDESARSPEIAGNPQVFKRLAGNNRYVTSRAIADEVLSIIQKSWGMEKYWCAVITTGENYPDALSGSFLANRSNAPMLMINEKNAATVVDYVKNHVQDGGRIYVLGGTGAVPDEWLGDLLNSDYLVKRLSGSNRYNTNLEILKETDVTGGVFLVCTGGAFADSLSCSSLPYPLLLVGKSLNNAQREYLNSLQGEYTGFYIIGGEGAVSAEIEAELANYGWTERIKGKNRYETSAAIANWFKWDSTNVVLATGKKFPDGLSGGPLANVLGAPLLLVDDGKTSYAEEYTARNGVGIGYVLGGTGAVSDDAMNKVFHIGE